MGTETRQAHIQKADQQVDFQSKSHTYQRYSWFIKVIQLFRAFCITGETVGSESLRMMEAEPVMFLFLTVSSVTIGLFTHLKKLNAYCEGSLGPRPGLFSGLYSSPDSKTLSTLSCSAWLWDLIILTAGLSYKILEICLIFSPFLPSYIHFPVRLSLGSSLSLSPPQSRCFYSPHNHPLLLSPAAGSLRDSGIRGIPEGGFSLHFGLSAWPLKTVVCQRQWCSIYKLVLHHIV